ncbi:MAG: hypothetical protein B6I26_02720 [Desulfobacteraceae bacterium 4572_130]|nr:MAG: hypothetical protein B6I26_02720 [Desulfobacteraceae bacterium 4572_130]
MKIDACGLSCPQPVLLTMNAIKDNKLFFEVMVDSNIACENIQRLAENKGYKIQIKKTEKKFHLILTK